MTLSPKYINIFRRLYPALLDFGPVQPELWLLIVSLYDDVIHKKRKQHNYGSVYTTPVVTTESKIWTQKKYLGLIDRDYTTGNHTTM